jgi:hypothetical protein
MAYTVMVSTASTFTSQGTHLTAHSKEIIKSVSQRKCSSPSVQETKGHGLSFVRRALQEKGISPETQDIILQSWRDGTRKQYQCYLKRWVIFANSRDINPISPSITEVLDFFTDLFRTGLKYSAINTAKSALGSFMQFSVNVPLGQEPLVKTFMKGVFNLKPTLPRYHLTWDANIVLKYLCDMPDVEILSLENLTYKLAMLTALITGQRNLKIEN